MSAALDDVVSSSDTIAGFVIWAVSGCPDSVSALGVPMLSREWIVSLSIVQAGSFDTSYALSVTPNSDGTDQLIWSEAVEQYLPG